jgi:chorismate mutase / prephenate dehydratase
MAAIPQGSRPFCFSEVTMKTTVARLRDRIDAIDAQLLNLLNQRAEVSARLGRRKREAGLGLRDIGREEQIITRARGLNPGPLHPEAVDRLFRAILAESRRVQAACAGPIGPEPHQAPARHPSSSAGRLQCA